MYPIVAFEAGAYELGLNATTVTTGIFAVITQNIVPVMTLMGIMLGFGIVRRMFKKAKHGSI